MKPGDEVVDKGNVEEGEVDLMNPQVAAKAAKERANLRNQFTAELFSEDTGGIGIDLSVGEVTYEVCFEVFFLSFQPGRTFLSKLNLYSFYQVLFNGH